MEIVIPAKTNAETLVTNPDKANRSTIARTTPSVTSTTVTATKSSRLARLLRDQALRSLTFDTFTRSHLRFSRVNTTRSRAAAAAHMCTIQHGRGQSALIGYLSGSSHRFDLAQTWFSSFWNGIRLRRPKARRPGTH